MAGHNAKVPLQLMLPSMNPQQHKRIRSLKARVLQSENGTLEQQLAVGLQKPEATGFSPIPPTPPEKISEKN